MNNLLIIILIRKVVLSFSFFKSIIKKKKLRMGWARVFSSSTVGAKMRIYQQIKLHLLLSLCTYPTLLLAFQQNKVYKYFKESFLFFLGVVIQKRNSHKFGQSNFDGIPRLWLRRDASKPQSDWSFAR